MIPHPPDPIVAALDVSSLDQAERLASVLAPHVGMLKVGLELVWAEGPGAVRRIAAHGPVFVASCTTSPRPSSGRPTSPGSARRC